MLKPLSIATVTALSLFVLVSFSLAQGPNVMLFHGTISFGEDPAPVGTEIVAKIDGVERGSITTLEVGKYGNESGHPKLIVNNGFDGDIILFFAKKPSLDVFIQANENATYDSGVSFQLNFTFPLFCGDNICDAETESCSICSQDCGACPSGPPGDGGGPGGGPSGGPGGGVPTQPPEEEEEEPELTEPPEEEPAPPGVPEPGSGGEPEEPTPPAPPTPAGFDITGFLTQNPVQASFGVAVLIIIILGGLIYWRAARITRSKGSTSSTQ